MSYSIENTELYKQVGRIKLEVMIKPNCYFLHLSGKEKGTAVPYLGRNAGWHAACLVTKKKASSQNN